MVRRTVALSLGLAFTAVLPLVGQSAVPVHSAAAQPKIIVIPFTKAGEDIRTVLDADFNRQVAVAKLKNAFDARHLATIDFQGALAAMKRDAAAGAESERDFLDRLLENNKADIYVIVNYRATVENGLTSVAVIMDSYLTANGASLSTETAHSRRNQESDVSRHIEQAIDHLGPAFLDGVQAKFDEFEEAGVPLAMTMRIGAGATVDFNTKPKAGGGTKSIADLMEDWADANAVNHGYNIGTSTKNLLQFTDIRIPIREPNGSPVSPRRFGSRVTSYLESVGVNATASMNNGAIYVDIR
ncbi:MAG TPA: DUF6175 family protein [Gemmatimonadaceae bacterium]